MAADSELISEVLSLEKEATAREREGDHRAAAMLYEKVIELLEALDLGNRKYRNGLGR